MTSRSIAAADLFNGWGSRLSHIAARLVPIVGKYYSGRPLVYFTFDDFPLSAAQHASSILERHQVRGTFYASTGLMDQAHQLWEMAPAHSMAALEARGHEIGLHTHEHRLAWEYDTPTFVEDLSANQRVIGEKAGGYVAETFAYPYGIGHWTHKRTLSRMVRAARSTYPGINAGQIDLHFLKAYELIDSAMTPESVDGLIDAAVKARGWLIFVSHDVASVPSPFGVSPQLLEHAVATAIAKKVQVLPVCEALDVIGVALEKP